MLYKGDTLYVDWLEDGIAELVFDAPGSVNKLDTATVASLGQALDVLEKQSDLKGLLLRSNKAAFIVGADITEFLSLFLVPEEQLSQWLHFANSVFNRLEDLPVPTLSAVNGYALGGGCECVLATDYRLATPDLRIGLPETKLGIMPGFGGSVRMPRMLGADSALEIIAAGKDVGAEQAQKIGLVDGVVKPEKLVEGAVAILRQAINGDLDWKAKRQPKLEPLKLSKIEATMSFTIAKGMVMQTAGKHYPAPITAVKTIEAAARLGRDDALKLENQSFVPLAHTNEARALVGIFLNDQFVKGKAKQLTKNVETPKHAAVLGAGIMGGGIAYQSAWKGVPVVMKDINEKSLTLGMTEAAKLLNKQLERGKIDGLKLAGVISTIQPVLEYSGFDRVDVVVEAVVENPKVKKAVLAETEDKVRPETVLASNTSTIPISELASVLKRPENFCGMHFFNPVHRMPLVEVIRGEKTSDETIAKVVAWASKMGKTPIVVNDCPGFFVNRVLFPYFAGFSQLLRDGADFRKIDKVMEKQFGWPMGPAYLLDVVGIDTAHHAQAVMAAGFPQRMQKDYRDAIDALFDANRFGQKNSLVLMDEVGRGTSTYDGLSLAWACAESLANKIKALTLFATHYFELTQLPEKMEGVANVHLDALEHGDTIAFMHTVQDGAASKSYGLAVAALAGVPKEVIKRARQKLRELESLSPNAAATQIDGTQMSLLAVPEETSPAVEALENLDPDSLTPRQALEWIYRLKSLV